MKIVCFALLMVMDIGCFYSVPKQIRTENMWSAIPMCGFVLAAEYHFGNKLSVQTPNV